MQDMAPYILAENLGRKWESGDRVPDDLTVAPVQVDVVTVVLLCFAGGMKPSGYPPATGEISMSGKVGAITSAVHPVLGVLLHYTPSVLVVANESLEEIRIHSRAMNQGKGVWANAVKKLRACLDTTVPFCSPIQMTLFLPFQNRKNPLFIVEMVAERNSPAFAKQALNDWGVGRGFLNFTMLLNAIQGILPHCGWPEGSYG